MKNIWKKIKKLFVRIDDGFLPEQPKIDDYVVGESPIQYEVRVFDGNHSEYLPEDEHQKRNNVETMSCVSFSALNSVEMQINWMINTQKISVGTMEFLQDNRYIVNDKVNLSDRFLAIMSSTTPRGNYLSKVASTLRHYGAIPEGDLSFGNPNNWNEYHDKTVIDDDMLKLGKEFLEHFTIQYEWVVFPSPTNPTQQAKRRNIHKHLKHTPLQFAKDGHAADFFDSTEDVRFMQYDTYKPFQKERPWTYDPLYVMKIVVTEKSEFSDKEIYDAKQEVLKVIVKDHGEKYFFRPDAHGEAYMIFEDGSFKYGTAQGSLFTQMTTDNTIVPISEDLWEKLRPAEIK